MILMSHPQHGFMNVYTDQEVILNEKQGWKKVEVPAVENVQKMNVQEVNTSLAEQYQTKFGKKPHHRMSQSTIEAALKD